MTTTPRPHSASNPYRREQLIASILVGATVVLLGFASGLGTTPSSASAASNGHTPSSMATMPSESSAPPSTPTSQPTPIHYVGVPEPVVTVTVGPTAAPSPSKPAVTSTSPSTPTSSPVTSSSSTTSPSGSCPSNVLSGLLSSLSVGTLLGGGSGSLLAGAGGTLPLTDILGLLFGSAGKSGNALPSLPLSTLTDLVSRLLPSVGGGAVASPSAAPMVTACTTSLASVVPIIGGTG